MLDVSVIVMTVGILGGSAIYFSLAPAVYRMILMKNQADEAKAIKWKRYLRITSIVMMVVGVIFMIIANVLN